MIETQATEKVQEQAKPEAIAVRPGDEATAMGFGSGSSFALLQRAATVLAKSTLVPTIYQNNLPNCMIALNMAARMNADVLLVMQNLYLVQGKPGWSAQFLIATLNQCGRFTALRYEWKGEPGSDDYGCRAWSIEKSTGERLNGSWVTWGIVQGEGWSKKNGSKWLTMKEQMYMYRAGSFFVRAYAPELAMGLQTAEELHDVVDLTQTAPGVYGATLDDQTWQEVNGVPSVLDELKAPRVNGGGEVVQAIESSPAAASTPEPPAQREPGDESENEPVKLSKSEEKAARGRITDLCGKLEGVTAYDLIQRLVGTRKVSEIPVERLYAVESALTDATAE